MEDNMKESIKEKEANYLKFKTKHSYMAYQLHDYLKSNCIGYENRKTSYEIMDLFMIERNKDFRKYIQEIRNSDIFQKIICSEAGPNGGYWVPTNDEEVYMTLIHLYKRAMAMLKTYSIIKNKHRLNNQMRLKLSKYERDTFESVIKE